MRLITLEIKNLASLDREEGEVIAFEEGALKDCTIFSIVGPTGSGKSTLLDAICLALYNRAPRYPRKKGDHNQKIEIYGEPTESEKNQLAPTDSRNILTRGKKNGYSKLTFVANNGQVYRAEWHVKFKQKNYDNVITNLYKIVPKDGKTVEEMANWDDLPTLIGLDYDQFLRTVLIAQGSFANFLTAKENERYELLEKLIGCEEQYTRIATGIKEQKDEAVKAFDRINAHFTAYEKDILAAEEVTDLQTKIAALEEADKQLKAELVKVNEALNWYLTDAKHRSNLESYREKLTLAQQQLNEAKTDIDRLQLHDATLQAVGIVKDIRISEANRKKLQSTLTDIEQHIGKQSGDIDSEEKLLQPLKEAEQRANEELEKQKPHLNKARTIEGELEGARRTVNEKAEARKGCEAADQKAQQEVKDNRTKIGQAQQQWLEAKQAYDALQVEVAKQKETLAQKVQEATTRFKEENSKIDKVDANRLQTAKNEAVDRQTDVKECLRLLTEGEKKQTLLQQHKWHEQQWKKRNNELTEALKKLHIEVLKAEVETLQKTYTLMTSENWSLHRQELKDGEPCPLCGATVHPYNREEDWKPVVNELWELLTQKKATVEKQNAEQQLWSKEYNENQGKLKSMEETVRQLTQEREELQRLWKVLQQKHADWPTDSEALKELLTQAEAEVNRTSAALDEYHNTLDKVNRLRQAKEGCEKEQQDYLETADQKLRVAEQKQTQAHTTLETEKGKSENLDAQAQDKAKALAQAVREEQLAKEKVAEKVAALKAEIGDRTPDGFEAELNKAREEATRAVNEKNEAIARLREQLKKLHGRKEETQKSLQEEEVAGKQHEEKLDEWLKAYNASGEQAMLTHEGVKALYEATDDWEAIRRRQNELQTQLTSAHTTLANEQTAHARHQEDKPAQTNEELSARKAQLEQQTNDELTDAKARMQRHSAAKQQMGQLFDQRQACEQTKREWEEITDAIGADGKTLRKIAQCYTLRFLIEHANAEIRKFNSRYELVQVKNSLGIRVIDHDRADDVRDTTSLSGGETFIVSLGLALGLSSLSSRNVSFENQFIDEGFGTLDPDTLAVVIDSLAMLQSSQGKKVGVISHTDTMSERIATQIRIVKNGHSGSSHIEIYP